MTIYVSLGVGDVSISRALTGDAGELEAQIVALLARLVRMVQTTEVRA